MSISVKRSNFTLAFFKDACHTNPGAERNFLESSEYRHITLKSLNTSANNNALL